MQADGAPGLAAARRGQHSKQKPRRGTRLGDDAWWDSTRAPDKRAARRTPGRERRQHTSGWGQVIEHRPETRSTSLTSLQSCVFPQCVRPRVGTRRSRSAHNGLCPARGARIHAKQERNAGRPRSRRRARCSGAFPLCAWEAGDMAQLVLSGGPWGERIGLVWNSAFICR